MKYLVRTWILLLLEIYPNRVYHQDPTIGDRTLDLHEEPQLVYLLLSPDQECLNLGKALHEGKIFDFQRQLSAVINQTNQCNISRRLHFRIFLSTHHKTHIPMLSILIRDFLSKWLFYPWTWLWEWQAEWLSLLNNNPYLHNLPWTGSWYLVTCLLF